MDEGTKKSLGEVSIPLARLMKEPGMELYQQTFMLNLGAQSAPLVATLRLRVSTLTPCPLHRPQHKGTAHEKEGLGGEDAWGRGLDLHAFASFSSSADLCFASAAFIRSCSTSLYVLATFHWHDRDSPKSKVSRGKPT